jgi:hypothetical protein
MVAVLATAFVSIALAYAGAYSWLVAFVVLNGLIEVPLLSITHYAGFQYLSDLPASVLVLASLVTAFTEWDQGKRRVVTLYGLLVLLAALEAVRSPSRSAGVAQARELLVPVGLLMAGYLLRQRIDWDRVLSFVLVVASAAAAWVLAEQVKGSPLLDPNWYYLHITGLKPLQLRYGPAGLLPGPYYANLSSAGDEIFRPGGPYMNPPITGYLLGIGAFAAMQRTRGFYRGLLLAIFLAALVSGYSRGGLVLFLLVVVMYTAWVWSGRIVTTVAGLATAAYLVSYFVQQGNTSSHAGGLVSGLLTALTHPIGVGFGVTGFQALLQGQPVGSGAESLIGLYLAWLGWPAIVAWRAVLSVPTGRSLPVWLAVGLIVSAATSESSSATLSTPMLWLVTGGALSMARAKSSAAPARVVRGERRPAGVGTGSHGASVALGQDR